MKEFLLPTEKEVRGAWDEYMQRKLWLGTVSSSVGMLIPMSALHVIVFAAVFTLGQLVFMARYPRVISQ